MINVIGLGYIGLPTALMLQVGGNHVVGTDIKQAVVEALNQGVITFEEKGLEDLYNQALEKGIAFSTQYQRAEMYIVAVPTPYIGESKRINPDYVIDAVKQIVEVCPKGAVIVIESTVSPNTIDKFIRPLIVDKEVFVAHAPERIIPGNMIYELEHNSRIVGADSKEIAEQIQKVYATFCKGEIVLTDVRTAELSKVAENTFRDINIAYANELALICDASGLDVYEVLRIANKHPRVNILQPGPGVGGHCISVDPWFLVGDFPEFSHVIKAARKVNDKMPEFVLEKMSRIMEERNITDLRRVGLYGLTYKENVDDTRESPTLQLLDCMKKHLAYGINVYDPYVKDDMVDNQYHSLEDFLTAVDMVVIMVAHDEIVKNQELLKGKVVFDTKNKITAESVYKL